MGHLGQDSLLSHIKNPKPHRHVCFIYEAGEEWEEFSVTFIAAGLDRGDRCLCIAGDIGASRLRKGLAREGIDVGLAENQGRLLIPDAFALSNRRTFDPEGMISYLRSQVERADIEGCPGLRIAADISSVLRDNADIDRLIDYETDLGRAFVSATPVVAVCQYDMMRFPANLLRRVIVAHPFVQWRSETIKNPFHVPLEKFVGADAEKYELRVYLEALKREVEGREARRQTEDRFRTVADFTYDWEYWISPDRLLIYCSPSCERITGRNAGEFLSDPSLLETIIHPDDRDRVIDHFQAEMEFCGEHELDFRIVTGDGDFRWIAHACRPVYDSEGAFTGRRVSNREITGRRQVADTLKAKEVAQRALLDATRESLLLVDRDGIVLAANRVFAERIGFEVESLIGQNVFDNFPPDIGAGRKKALISAGERGVPVVHEDIREGRIIRATICPVSDEGGNIIQFAVYGEDITEKRKAEAELKRNERLFRTLWHMTQLVDTDLETVRDFILQGITSTTESTYGFLGSMSEEEDAISVCSWFPETMEDCVIHYNPLNFLGEDASLWRTAVRTRQPVIVNEYQKNYPDKRDLPEGHVAIRSLLVVPIFQDNRTISIAAVANKRDAYTAEDVRAINVIVSNAEAILAKRRIEEDVRVSEEKYRKLVESIDDAIMVTDGDRRILASNTGFTRLFGYDEKDAKGSSARILHTSYDSYRRFGEEIYPALQGNGTARTEWNFLQEDGNTVSCETVVSTMHREGEHPAGYVHVMRDVSARKKTEATLLKSAILLKSIQDAQSLFIAGSDVQNVCNKLLKILVEITESEYGFLDEVIKSEEGEVYKASLALSDISWDEPSKELYQRLKARSLEFRNLKNLAGLPALTGELLIANDISHDRRSGGLPEGHPAIRAFMGIPVFYGGELVGVAGVANRKDGYSEEAASFISPLISTCGGIIQSIRNARREDQHRESLRKSEEKFRLAMDAVNDVLWDWNIKTGEVFWSDRFYELTGYDVESGMRSRVFWESLVHPGDIVDVLDRVRSTLDGSLVSHPIEYRVVTRDGSCKWVLERGKVVAHDNDGLPLRMIGTISDVTDRVEARNHLEESLREKETLIKEVQHRVKNNLQVVSGLLYLTGSGVKNVEALRVLEEARGRIEAMSLIHGQLCGSGNLERIDMDASFRELVAYLSQIHLNGRSGISFRMQFGSVELSLSQAMPCSLILNELISNALKHAFAGYDRGEIQISMDLNDRGIVRIVVNDNGAGLPDGFDIRKADTVGLTLVRNLAEGQLKGTLEVGRDEGSRFTVIFRKTQ